MKKIILFFMFILMSSSVFGLYEEKIFTGWVDSGKRFAIADENYTATFVRQNNLTVIKFPGGYQDVIGNNETCHEGWIYKACLMDTKYELGGAEVPFDIHQENIDISLKLEIYASYSNIEIQKEIEKKDLLSKEATQVNLILNNTGKLDSDVYAIDEYAKTFSITILKGRCIQDDGKVILDTHLKSSLSEGCQYRIRPLENGTFQNIMSVNYTILDRSKVKTQTDEINVQKSAILVEPSQLEINKEPSENQTIWVNVTALQDLEVQKMAFILPEKIALIDTTGEFRENTKSIYWEGMMVEGDIHNFSFNIKSDLIINESIEYVINYFAEGVSKSLTGKYDFKSSQDLFYIGKVNVTNMTVLRIVNPTKNIFRDIKINLYDNGEKIKEHVVDELGALRFREFEIDGPIENYDVQFKTVYGQPLSMAGQITGIKITNIFENITKQEEPKQEEVQAPVIKQKEEKKKFNFDIDLKIISIIAGVIFLILITITIILKPGKQDDIEKEIAELKKQENEENKNE